MMNNHKTKKGVKLDDHKHLSFTGAKARATSKPRQWFTLQIWFVGNAEVVTHISRDQTPETQDDVLDGVKDTSSILTRTAYFVVS